jgi:hypothetical protein
MMPLSNKWTAKKKYRTAKHNHIYNSLLLHVRVRDLMSHSNWLYLTLNLLMSYIYEAPSKARNLTSYIYG